MATILVADDDQLLRAIIRDQLERADHEVLEAGDGIAAIDIALDERPDVLLLDVMMPLARGLEVVRRVRHDASWHPVIVMISARTRVTDRLNALDAGADAYVEKPFEPDELLDTVERLLADAPAARYVDILGPVWTTLAVERLARDAFERRSDTPADTEPLAELFTDLVASSLGHAVPQPSAEGPGAGAVRLLWEDAIRALLRDATEPVPTITSVPTLDALAAVQRAIGDETLRRHRATLGPSASLDAFWADQLAGTLGPPHVRSLEPATAAPDPWITRLRAVLDGPSDDESGDRWHRLLRNIMAPSRTPDGLDTLQVLWLMAATQRTRAEAPR